jgi:hypothetical protein
MERPRRTKARKPVRDPVGQPAGAAPRMTETDTCASATIGGPNRASDDSADALDVFGVPLPKAGAMAWDTYAEPCKVGGELLTHLRAGATPEEVRRLAQGQGMEVSALIDDVVYASAAAISSHPMILAKWLVQFQFEGDRLREIRVKRGLTGP